jgi:hypothetical protein
LELTLISEENHCIYVEEDKEWELKGRYQAAVQQNEDVEWSVLGKQFSLKLLIVCFRNSGCNNISKTFIFTRHLVISNLRLHHRQRTPSTLFHFHMLVHQQSLLHLGNR